MEISCLVAGVKGVSKATFELVVGGCVGFCYAEQWGRTQAEEIAKAKAEWFESVSKKDEQRDFCSRSLYNTWAMTIDEVAKSGRGKLSQCQRHWAESCICGGEPSKLVSRRETSQSFL